MVRLKEGKKELNMEWIPRLLYCTCFECVHELCVALCARFHGNV
jgi:hypothetical protein